MDLEGFLPDLAMLLRKVGFVTELTELTELMELNEQTKRTGLNSMHY